MANYAHIENETITGVYDLYPDNWRNISNFYLLENDIDTLRSLGWRTIIKSIPSYNIDTQRLGNPIHTITNDEVYETLEIVDVVFPEEILHTPEQLASIILEQHNAALELLRKKRDKLLADTDFTQLTDVIAINGTELNQLFITYRQSLRDLPTIYENNNEFVNEATVIYPSYPVLIVTIPEVNTEETTSTSTESVTATSDGEPSNPGDS
jgi:hypothetical protein